MFLDTSAQTHMQLRSMDWKATKATKLPAGHPQSCLPCKRRDTVANEASFTLHISDTHIDLMYISVPVYLGIHTHNRDWKIQGTTAFKSGMVPHA